MYNATEEVRNLFLSHKRQSVLIQLDTAEESLSIDESSIIQGSCTIDRYCVSGNKIEVGSAIAAEVKFSLDNRNGIFDDIRFEGAELYVKIGVKNGDRFDYIPIGYFTVDTSPRKKAIMEIAALDRMVRFDRAVGDERTNFGTNRTVSAYVQQCCQICGVILKTDLSQLINSSYIIPAFPEDEEITYRQLIQWCAALMGTCAYIDWNGELCFEWYTDNETDVVVTSAERFSSDMYENDIAITGVYAEDGEENAYIVGIDAYAIDLTDNQLLQSEYESVLTNLYSKIGSFFYRPYSCVIKPMPYLYPLDRIKYVDKKGIEHITIVTNVTVKLNGNTTIAGKGETATSNSYNTRQLTSKAATVLNKIKNDITTVSEKGEMVLHLNETIGNAMGLYCTEQTDSDGAIKYYYHNTASLEESSIIYTFNDGGFAWANAWNEGSPVWQYGITSSGNAILNYLTVNKLTADHISVSDIVGAINESTGDSTLSITAEHLNLNGFISANGTFSVDEAGYMTATGGEIAGLIMESIQTEESGVIYTERTLRTQNDNFHISVTTNENTHLSTSEVSISQLFTDDIISNDGENEIDMSYGINPVTITAKILGLSYELLGYWGNGVILKAYIRYELSSNNSQVTQLQKDVTLYTECVWKDGSDNSFTVPTAPNMTLRKGYTMGTHTYSSNVLMLYFPTSELMQNVECVFSNNGSTQTTFVDKLFDESRISIKGDIVPRSNTTYNFGSTDYSFKNGYFQNLFVDNKRVSTPNISWRGSIAVGKSSGNTPSNFSSNGYATRTTIECGNLLITNVEYSTNIEEDKWYFFDISGYGTIYSVQVSKRASSSTSLSANNYSGALSVFWNSSNQVFVGCDSYKCQEGFIVTIIGMK